MHADVETASLNGEVSVLMPGMAFPVWVGIRGLLVLTTASRWMSSVRKG